MSSIFLLLRLALATGVVLLPGWIVARAVGVRGASATLSWALVVVFGALGVTFFVRGTLTLTLVLLLVVGAGVLPFTRGGGKERAPGWLAVAFAGAVVGLLLWHVAGEVGGDGLFHLARVRKLVELDGLSLQRVGEFPDGGLHPGYAFPLWQGYFLFSTGLLHIAEQVADMLKAAAFCHFLFYFLHSCFQVVGINWF